MPDGLKSSRRVWAVLAWALMAAGAQAQSILRVNAAAAPGGDGSSWATAISDLQAALDAAAPIAAGGGDVQVWVKSGTYFPSREATPGDRRSVTFALQDHVGLYGGFGGTETSLTQRTPLARVTTLSGAIGTTAVTDNAYHVLMCESAGGQAVVDGFTVIDGNADGAAPHATGGGMLITGGQPTIRTCTFRGNRSSSHGGGIAVTGSSSPLVMNCEFRNNFTVVAAPGNDRGGAIYCEGPSTPTILGSVFRSNGSEYGGGVSCVGATVSITNCSMYQNNGQVRGGAIDVEAGTASVSNCIFYLAIGPGSGETKEIGLSGASLAINYSFVTGWTGLFGGTGNIGGDPRFLLTAGSPAQELDLLPNSPCIDRGSNPLVPGALTTDRLGKPRFHNDPLRPDLGVGPPPIVDMGAFEYSLRDCNGNSIDDAVETGNATAADCNDNGVPDSCDPDCDGNGSPDGCPLELDCNGNLIPDACDIASGYSLDLNQNGAPDECDHFIYVNAAATGANDGSSWADAYTDLQSALAQVAVPGQTVNQVWVAQGIYYPAPIGGLRSASFVLAANVGLFGGFAGNETVFTQRNHVLNVTTLSADLNRDDPGGLSNNADNTYHVVTAASTATLATLDGFTIRGGNANGSSSNDRIGGGLRASSVVVSVRNCTFRDNDSLEFGGAVNAAGFFAGCTFSNCLFTANRGNSAVSGSGRFDNCTFSSNLLGAVYNLEGSGISATFTNCTFTGNTRFAGGAVQGVGSFFNCTFSDNSCTQYGGAVFGPVQLTDCTFTDNTTALWGGALVVPSGAISVTGCTFQDNHAQRGGAVFTFGDSDVLFTDCDFVNNTSTEYAGAVMFGSGGDVVLDDCDFIGNSAGTWGGAIADLPTGAGRLRMQNCRVTNNSAPVEGGGLHISGHEAVLLDSTFSGNAAPAGAGVKIAQNTHDGFIVIRAGELRADQSTVDGLENVGTLVISRTDFGDDIGSLTINGDFVQRAVSGAIVAPSTQLQVGGQSPAEYDRLIVTGNVELAGGLRVQLTNGYVPDPAQPLDLDLIDAANTIGTFDVAYLPALPRAPDGSQPFLRIDYGQEQGGAALGIGVLGGEIGFGGPVGTDTSGIPTDAAAADFDGINGPDLVVTIPASPPTAPGSAFVFYNAGTIGGVWQGFLQTTLQLTTGANPSAVDTGDIDRRQRADFAVSNEGSDTVSVFTNTGSGLFTLAATVTVADAPTDVLIGDMNHNALTFFPDLVVGSSGGTGSLAVYINNENQSSPAFTLGGSQPTGPSRHKASLTDIDNDKDLDTALTLQGDATARVYTNPGNGAIVFGASVAVGTSPRAIAATDFNGDGLPDLITANATGNSVSIIRNNTVQQDTPVLASSVELPNLAAARALATLDIELDGDDDVAVIVTAGGDRTIQILRNDVTDPANLAFAPSDLFTPGNGPLLLVTSDVDIDGRTDLITINDGTGFIADGLTVLPNTSTPPPSCGSPDFDGDGDTGTDADIEAFLLCLGGDCCGLCGSPDFDGDGDTGTDADIEAFFRVLGGGAC